MRKLMLLLLTTVSIAFTVSVGAMALILAGWGAFNNQTYYIESMQEYLRWTQAEAFWSYELRYPLLYGACALLVISILLVFAMVATSGHKKGHDEIVLRWQDKIPLDLYAFVVACLETAFVVLVMVGMQYSWSPQSFIGLMGFAAVPASFLGLNALLSLAIRFKAGGWWRNTIVYKICRGIFNGIQKIIFGVNQTGTEAVGVLAECIETLPLVWKVMAMVAVVFFLNLFFVLSVLWNYGGWRTFLFIVWVLFDGIVVIVLIRLLKQLLVLKEGAEHIAAGDMDYQIDTDGMMAEFRQHGQTLNSISAGLNQAVEQRMKSERLKTELITNVSHDIKTPLTSIINYVDLLQKENMEGTAKEYLEVLSRQSNRLKRLIENLVEASKASTGNIKVNLQRLGVCEFMHQVVAEYVDRLEARGLRAVVSVPDKELYVMADGRLLWRVFDNLLNNVCKYALEGTRVYVDVHQHGNEVQIVFKNISKERLNIAADELMERFVRGDSSRNTEGSGLGLSIAQSLTQSQRGSFELFVDGDLFKAVVCFKLLEVREKAVPKNMEEPVADLTE